MQEDEGDKKEWKNAHKQIKLSTEASQTLYYMSDWGNTAC